MDVIVQRGRPSLLRVQSIVVVVRKIDRGVVVDNLRLARSRVVNGGLRAGAIAPAKTELPVSIVVTKSLHCAGTIREYLDIAGGIVNVGLEELIGVRHLRRSIHRVVSVRINISVLISVRMQIPG